MLEGILLELTHAPMHLQPRPGWLQKAIKRLSDCALGGEIDYTALAEELGTSPATFRRRFREATGTSPHEYRLHCRGAEARRLLGESDLPIKQVAMQLGYRDVYFFSRQFRQFTGVPPAAYRRSRQG
jgi:AraC family transcriptional regulator